MSKELDTLRDRSGRVDHQDKLVEFLYTLMRDYLPPGTIEEIMKDTSGEMCKYTNGFLARYAKDIANRLKEDNNG